MRQYFTLLNTNNAQIAVTRSVNKSAAFPWIWIKIKRRIICFCLIVTVKLDSCMQIFLQDTARSSAFNKRFTSKINTTFLQSIQN